MKRLLTLLLVLVLCIAMCACSGQSNADTETENEEVVESDPHNVEAIDLTSENGSIQFHGTQIASTELLSAHQGEYKAGDALIVEYTFTLTQEQPAKCPDIFEIKYYQNGIEIADTLWTSDKDPEQFNLCRNYHMELMNGGSAVMGRPILVDGNSPLTVMVTDLADKDNYQIMVIENYMDESQIPDEMDSTIPLEEPVVLLDNEHVRIVITAKCDGTVIGQDNAIGYIAELENKSDSQYLSLAMVNCNMDGYMLEDSCYFGNQKLSPSTKSTTYLYLYTDRETLLGLETVDDLVNLNGSVQIAFSDDGATFRNHTVFPFDNIIP